MGLFNRRSDLAPTKEEQDGVWTRTELLAHWKTIPDSMKVAALSSATADQLRVMGWVLPHPHDRFLAICQVKQRRESPDLFQKIEETGELAPEEFEEWIKPLKAMHGRKIIRELADQMYEDLYRDY